MSCLGRHDDRDPVRIDDDLARQFHAMGADIAPQTTPEDETEGVEIMPENWTVICAFLACQTQWRIAVSLVGREWLGFEYPGVDVVLTRRGFDNEVFADLQVMEIAALEAFGEAAS